MKPLKRECKRHPAHSQRMVEEKRAALVLKAVERLEEAHKLLADAEAICAQRVYFTLENVKWNYEAFWEPKMKDAYWKTQEDKL